METFISGANFSSGLHRHEVDPVFDSHYKFYVETQNTMSLNFKAFAEDPLGFRAYSDATFLQLVRGRLTIDATAIENEILAKGEPCSMHCTPDSQGYYGPANIRPYR